MRHHCRRRLCVDSSSTTVASLLSTVLNRTLLFQTASKLTPHTIFYTHMKPLSVHPASRSFESSREHRLSVELLFAYPTGCRHRCRNQTAGTHTCKQVISTNQLWCCQPSCMRQTLMSLVAPLPAGKRMLSGDAIPSEAHTLHCLEVIRAKVVQ